MVRYAVKPDHVAHNEELVQAVLAELQRVQPAGLRYAAFRLDDGVSFIHLVSRDIEHGDRPPPQLPALKEFHAGIRERCDQPPVREGLSEIGSFRLFGDG